MKTLFKGLVVGLVLGFVASVGAQIVPQVGQQVPTWVLPGSAVNGGGGVQPSTCAAPAINEVGAATTGIAFTATPSILNCITGTAVTTLTGSAFTLGSGVSLAFPTVSFSNGTANRLDLATGDSLYLVSGGLGVGVANTTAGTIAALTSMSSPALTTTGAQMTINVLSAHKLQFATNNTNTWNIASGGHLLADGAYNIGDSAGNSPVNIYAENDIWSARYVGWLNKSWFYSGTDGIIVAANNAGTGFTRLILGTNDTSGFSWVKDGVGIVLADGAGTAGAFLAGVEQTAPAAPAANGYRIYAQDNGAGKTQVCALFSSGVAQCFATQP